MLFTRQEGAADPDKQYIRLALLSVGFSKNEIKSGVLTLKRVEKKNADISSETDEEDGALLVARKAARARATRDKAAAHAKTQAIQAEARKRNIPQSSSDSETSSPKRQKTTQTTNLANVTILNPAGRLTVQEAAQLQSLLLVASCSDMEFTQYDEAMDLINKAFFGKPSKNWLNLLKDAREEVLASKGTHAIVTTKVFQTFAKACSVPQPSTPETETKPQVMTDGGVGGDTDVKEKFDFLRYDFVLDPAPWKF